MADRKPLFKNPTTGTPRQIRTDDRVTIKGVVAPSGSILDEVSGEWQLNDTVVTSPVTLETIVERKNITQTAHGFTIPSFGFLPLVYNNGTGEFDLADATTTDCAADVFAVALPDANTITIQESGILNVTHGLTVGEWYVLDKNTPGNIVSFTSLTGTNENVQYLAFPIDANTLIVRPDPMFIEDFFVPQNIAILDEWGTGAPALSAGTDRYLFVAVSWEDSGANSITDVTVGGISGTELVEQTVTAGFANGTAIYGWTDAEIETMVGSAVVVSWASGAPLDFEQANGMIQFADQVTAPLVNSDSGTGGTDTLDADVNTLAGGYAVLSASGGNTGIGFTNNGTGWTRKINMTITSADGVVDDKLISADATPENVNMGITGSNRHTMVAVSIGRRES